MSYDVKGREIHAIRFVDVLLSIALSAVDILSQAHA